MTWLLKYCDFNVNRIYSQVSLKVCKYLLYELLFCFFRSPRNHAYFDYCVFFRSAAGVIEISFI
ncbi:hypothetical protein PGR6_33660 [Pseudomonas sp. GR 6-02]|nr:hypothetical protein PGR6_33660 [Pseudomonas sp. GR 6-02]